MAVGGQLICYCGPCGIQAISYHASYAYSTNVGRHIYTEKRTIVLCRSGFAAYICREVESFEGDFDSRPCLFHLDFCAIYFTIETLCTLLCTFC